jgi:hypothetical protein
VTPPCHDRSKTFRALTRLTAMMCAIFGLQTVVLVSQIGLCLQVHKLNLTLSAINGRLAAKSERVESR